MATLDGWAVTINGRSSMLLREINGVRRVLDVLDGSKFFAYSLWRLPPQVSFDQVDLTAWPTDYLQTAGSRDRMTVELRSTATPDGIARHVVLGRMHADRTSTIAMETVKWDKFEVTVMQHELFDADESYVAFVAYLRDQTLASYPQRPL